VLQGRRRQQQSEPFQHRMKHRNAMEGTQSELVRGHGLRQARYRGLEKVRLQNDFIGAACNVKRWIRREVWQLEQGMRRILSPGECADGAVSLGGGVCLRPKRPIWRSGRPGGLAVAVLDRRIWLAHRIRPGG